MDGSKSSIEDFYPRSPCGERRTMTTTICTALKFLSTLSLRRATCYSLRYSASRWHFYPRSPCGERHIIYQRIGIRIDISIHALLAESDVEKVPADVFYQAFLSTLSLRRATIIKIRFLFRLSNFYPRSPCGERPSITESCSICSSNFYPRSPCGERPGLRRDRPEEKKHFYPRSPCGERLESRSNIVITSQFLSTLSLRRATPKTVTPI